MNEAEKNKYIEKIIDKKKRNGEIIACYNVRRSVSYAPNHTHFTSETHSEDTAATQGVSAVWSHKDDLDSNGDETDQTESEVTVVKCKKLKLETGNLEPGDGTHMSDNPSLVNLVTLVNPSENSATNGDCREHEEYFVPLSSWDPPENEYVPDRVAMNGCSCEDNVLKVRSEDGERGGVSKKSRSAGKNLITKFATIFCSCFYKVANKN